jgi:hypothetical protein
MRKGIEVRLGPGDRERLEAVIGSGNSPQKHVWRARIVLLSAERAQAERRRLRDLIRNMRRTMDELP